MTAKVMTMLGQVQALHEYLDENASSLDDVQAKLLQEAVDRCWEIAERRAKERG